MTATHRKPRRKAKGLLILQVVVAAAVLPAMAEAGPRAVYEQVFSSAIPGAPARAVTRILYRHPDDPDAKPIAVRREVFTFPRGTRFNSVAIPDCTASDLALQLLGESACPPESRIGHGKGTFMTGFPGAGATPMEIDIFDTATGFLVLGAPRDFPLRMVARATRRGRVVTVIAPPIPGGPPDGESAIRRVHNILGAGGRTYIRTPRTCPSSGVWTFRARLIFADGIVDKNVHRMPCRAAT